MVLAGESAGGAVTRTVPADGPGCRARFLLGAYVLGGLSEQEEVVVEAHLSRCARCRVECEELACMPGWLNLIPPDEFGEPIA